MKRNFKLLISYDGTELNGWQFQPNARTIQGDIENELKKLFFNQTINLIGAGRTDSGVHAIEQVANIVLESDWDVANIKNALNANLKNDIYIKDVIEIDKNFHARFSAIKRSYKYYVTNEYLPMHRFSTWYTKKRINFETLSKCALLIEENNDFTNFCKTNSEVKNKNCEVFQSNWKQVKSNYIYNVKSNRFLHHMVRFLVGTMVEVSRERIPIEEFKKMLQLKKTNYKVFCAPAKGLFLENVKY